MKWKLPVDIETEPGFFVVIPNMQLIVARKVIIISKGIRRELKKKKEIIGTRNDLELYRWVRKKGLGAKRQSSGVSPTREE